MKLNPLADMIYDKHFYKEDFRKKIIDYLNYSFHEEIVNEKFYSSIKPIYLCCVYRNGKFQYLNNEGDSTKSSNESFIMIGSGTTSLDVLRWKLSVSNEKDFLVVVDKILEAKKSANELLSSVDELRAYRGLPRNKFKSAPEIESRIDESRSRTSVIYKGRSLPMNNI